jgi:hypothetical protein
MRIAVLALMMMAASQTSPPPPAALPEVPAPAPEYPVSVERVREGLKRPALKIPPVDSTPVFRATITEAALKTRSRACGASWQKTLALMSNAGHATCGHW